MKKLRLGDFRTGLFIPCKSKYKQFRYLFKKKLFYKTSVKSTKIVPETIEQMRLVFILSLINVPFVINFHALQILNQIWARFGIDQ